jgi:ankyrin repeat protein
MRKALVLGLLLLGSVSAPVFAGVAENRLVAAVKDSDHAALKAALVAHPNVNAPLPDKSSALAWAVDRQDADSVKLLLAAGARPGAVAGAVEPFSLACELGNPVIVTALLKAGANAKEIRADGTSAFALCAGSATPDVLAAMQAKGATIDGVNVENQTPLMWAAMAGNTDNIKWLLAHGAKVNAADKKGFTPIFFALRSKAPAASMALLDEGADVNVVVADGTSVVQAALTTHNIPFAIQAVNRGADLHRADKQGRQLIHLAAASGDAAFVKIVLSKGADPNAMVEADAAPAGRGGRVAAPAPAAPVVVANAGAGLPAAKPVADVAAGGAANPNAAVDAAIAQRRARLASFRPPQPSTPLQFAARAGSVAVMKALVEAGARPDEKTDDGMTVAMAAAGSGVVDAMAYAYQIDPHLDVIASGGRSIMHIAVAASGTPDPIAVIQFLVDKGAPLAIEDSRHDSPGDMLSRGGDPVIREFYIKLLRDRGIVSTNH